MKKLYQIKDFYVVKFIANAGNSDEHFKNRVYKSLPKKYEEFVKKAARSHYF